MGESVRVVLDAGSQAWRRRLGPMAWAVLEDLAFDVRIDETGAAVARTSARRVAEHLDIQPGTAARALRRLRDEQLVTLVREAGAGGRFGVSVYRLADIGCLNVVDRPESCVDPPITATPYVATPNTGSPDVDGPTVDRRRSAERRVPAPRVAAPPEGAPCGASPASERQGWGWRPSDVGEPAGPGVVGAARAHTSQREGSFRQVAVAGAPTTTPPAPGLKPIHPVQLRLFDDHDPSSAEAAGLRSLS